MTKEFFRHKVESGKKAFILVADTNYNNEDYSVHEIVTDNIPEAFKEYGFDEQELSDIENIVIGGGLEVELGLSIYRLG